jgi:hypothetical protein
LLTIPRFVGRCVNTPGLALSLFQLWCLLPQDLKMVAVLSMSLSSGTSVPPSPMSGASHAPLHPDHSRIGHSPLMLGHELSPCIEFVRTSSLSSADGDTALSPPIALTSAVPHVSHGEMPAEKVYTVTRRDHTPERIRANSLALNPMATPLDFTVRPLTHAHLHHSASVSPRTPGSAPKSHHAASRSGEVVLNPIAPCGACNEWLKKIAETNPDFKVRCYPVLRKHGCYQLLPIADLF